MNVYIERIHLFDYDPTALSLVSNILVGSRDVGCFLYCKIPSTNENLNIPLT
jgi:hypothetical protein